MGTGSRTGFTSNLHFALQVGILIRKSLYIINLWSDLVKLRPAFEQGVRD